MIANETTKVWVIDCWNHLPGPIQPMNPIKCREHLGGMLDFHFREAA